jgi:hypothetical protein
MLGIMYVWGSAVSRLPLCVRDVRGVSPKLWTLFLIGSLSMRILLIVDNSFL